MKKNLNFKSNKSHQRHKDFVPHHFSVIIESRHICPSSRAWDLFSVRHEKIKFQ